MTGKLFRALPLALFTILLPGSLFAAADVITIGTVTASGNTVDVPLSVRDVAGTSLGMDQPSGARIQSFSFKVDYSPASAVSSVNFSRSGITTSLNPTFESKPSTSTSASLLMTFQESSNPIPFTLNASAPGNKVAHLVFTLSGSAPPNTTITLTLDPAVTQLTDDGGTSATKESVAKSNLTLVNGAINIPPLAITLSPGSPKVQIGKTTTITVNANNNVASATTVTLASSATGIATVPSSVVINGGSKSTTFAVSGVAAGTANITATLPQADGGGADSVTVTVSEQPAPCAVPIAPQIAAPETAASGATYTVSWAAVTNATTYSIDESTDETFTSVTTKSVSTTSASFIHSVTGDTRYFYRVRAENRATGCTEISAASNALFVLVAPTPAAPAKRVMAVVGSTPGNAGAYFRTSVQLFNYATSPISGRIVFHPAGSSAKESDASLTYTLGAGKTIAYADLLPALGIGSGIGSADLFADVGSTFPVSLVRVFNDAGASGTTGLAQELLPPDDALQQGEFGAIIAPSDITRFRLNIGVRTLDAGATFTITVRNADGDVVKTVQKSFPVSYFVQTSSTDMLNGYALTGGETLSFTIDEGSAFIYGAMTDNTTNDPSQQFVHKLE
jgi:uncharacterized protein YjdB